MRMQVSACMVLQPVLLEGLWMCIPSTLLSPRGCWAADA